MRSGVIWLAWLVYGGSCCSRKAITYQACMAACYEAQRPLKFPILETFRRLHEETKLFCLWEESIYFKGKSFAASWSLLGIAKVLWIQLSVCVSSFLTAFDLTRYRVAKAEHICSGECGGLLWIEITRENSWNHNTVCRTRIKKPCQVSWKLFCLRLACDDVLYCKSA